MKHASISLNQQTCKQLRRTCPRLATPRTASIFLHNTQPKARVNLIANSFLAVDHTTRHTSDQPTEVVVRQHILNLSSSLPTATPQPTTTYCTSIQVVMPLIVELPAKTLSPSLPQLFNLCLLSVHFLTPRENRLHPEKATAIGLPGQLPSYLLPVVEEGIFEHTPAHLRPRLNCLILVC